MNQTILRLLPCAALAFLLAGCTPSGQKAGSPASLPQATAPAIQPAAAPSSAQAAPAPPPVNPQQKQVDDLIAKVEAAYAAGNADYRKGRLPQAKVQFDHAVDIMLTSGLDIKGNPQLLDEFNRVIDQVNSLEMEALQQGNGFAPKVEPSPADVANDITFKVDPNFVARAKSDLATTHSDLPLVMNDYVAAFINFFANTQRGHNTLLHAFQRSGRYRAMIRRVLAEEGVPQDLIYLAVAESGFQPRAIGPRTRHGGRAGGMWQFMPGNEYGLVRNRYVDERFDPEKSTRAYARYMKFLYNQLGDWYLAMAAYDHGAGNIQHAVARTGYASFWQLYKRHELPTETENYVPEILAAIIIAGHPRQYGFDDITLDPPVITDTVSIDYSVDLRLVSDLVDTPVSEIAALNPSLLGFVTPPDMPFDLHLPAGTASLFEQRIAEIPESKRDSWRYHRVAAGDTLESVATEFHVSLSELAATNQLGIHDPLDGVQALIVPVARSVSHSLRYTVRHGDTLISIADRFGVSLSDLRRWNHLRGNTVRTGRHIYVAEPLRPTSARHHSTHRRSRSRHASTAHRRSSASHKKRSTSSHSAHAHKKTTEKN
ncbi:MAG TPA: transglycosylase SLT domain-containing protein [Terracidiphilus sp.]|nr:transglycosylase SLT domain-containing protein [Terracidiphilus sp.]